MVPFILHYERLLLFWGKASFCRRIASQKGIEEPLNVSYIISNDCRFGYLSNTKIKFILVTTDQDVRDADVRNVS